MPRSARSRLALLAVALVALALLAPARAPAAPAPAEKGKDGVPGEGVLQAVDQNGRPLGPCPLQHTDVKIEVSGDLARAVVTQRFHNPFSHRIEAVYAFPLPEKAAVNAFEMRIGDRVIAGVLKKRDEAREEYEKARERGETASLLEQERPNLFTQSVANIPPGGQIDVQLTYVDALAYEQGAYHVAFPLTIGPKFNPEGRVPDAGRVSPPYAIGTRAGHDVAISVDVDAGVPLRDVKSVSHQIQVERRGGTRALVSLAPTDTIPNRDFLLDVVVEPDKVASGVLAHTRRACDGAADATPDCDGYLKLLLVPTGRPAAADVTPKELIFVMDTSGSMYGTPLDTSKKAMHRALSSLNPRDTFAILRYSDDASALSERPLANTPENVKRALAYVDKLEGEGGTEALAGVRAAFAYPHEDGRLRVVVFMTDGFIGNEDEILAEIRKNIGGSRLFAVGIGSSVNRYLIDGMAAAGRGAELVVTPRDKPEAVIDRLTAMVQSPYLTDVEIDWGGLSVRDLTPSPVPDLFAGQPLAVWARYDHPGSGTVRVRGKLAGKPWEQALAVTLPAREPKNAAVATIWARREIERLSGEGEVKGEGTVRDRITELALTHNLMTKYTSFVAVEHREVAAPSGGPPQRVDVPSEMPEGVSPERIFGDLSLQRFQPGDPELRVHAPASARAVTVVFPFGETKAATFDPRVSAWTVRFLVPRSEAEGLHFIDVIVVLADGSVDRFRVPYAVDASAARFEVRALAPLVPGSEIVVEAVQVPTESDRALHARRRGRALKAEVIADVTRVAVRTPDGQVLELQEVSPGTWQGRWRVPAGTGPRAELRLTSVDMAGNTGVETVTIGAR